MFNSSSVIAPLWNFASLSCIVGLFINIALNIGIHVPSQARRTSNIEELHRRLELFMLDEAVKHLDCPRERDCFIIIRCVLPKVDANFSVTFISFLFCFSDQQLVRV